ncbi:RrF2 family transcriptional regulator [Thalassotalea piscium]|uniref:Rrf2 family nitric oxide-sensitive transcriptional repressor n=1 Tax=Thalassotalea piscium TaxID=1230533 RepID=A0A7X0NE25_9GAMM|nr:Rrf2 family transcriptional regulator [Thalassotalea piscium]MBB6541717.1 Rrf2 family nitric oxide-sensitive transcriptional repressor [Thalassotalea piscium]
MQLTRHTDYGIRILMYLALLPANERASIDAISEIYNISRNNVNKIVHQLGKAKVIETRRGKGGGFYLSKAPKHINIGDIVMLLESTLEVVDCQKQQCLVLPSCKFKQILNSATNAFLEVLKEYTLADLVKDSKSDLTTILKISV